MVELGAIAKLMLCSLLVTTLAGCASTAPRTVVLPLEVIGGGAGLESRLRRTLELELEQRGRRAAPAEAEVAAAVSRSAPCQGKLRSPACARGAGQLLGADQVVVGAVAGLGQTVVVELQLYEVSGGALRGQVEKTFQRGQEELGSVALGLLGQPERRSSPRWYRRWWLWTAVGVALAVGITVPLTVTGRGGDELLRMP